VQEGLLKILRIRGGGSETLVTIAMQLRGFNNNKLFTYQESNAFATFLKLL